MDKARPMRADARRNYEQLLEQARIAFAEFGADASLDEIARRAGVASGTLYRHFPTRLDLIETVLAGQIEELVELGRRLLADAGPLDVDSRGTGSGDADSRHADSPDPAPLDALTVWLRAAVVHGLTYRGLAAAVMNSALSHDLVAGWHAEMFAVGADLLARAREAGAITAVADDADVLRMVGAIAWAAQDAPETADRLLALLVDGLRYGGAS
ncbi:TetR/AcrR family transcriptional regulator [Kutzneria buriramensis]|uniref:AcrR family transcriptional regulator n=1 Tax=Kutzneria buriramensis TaxID=1045776 RepID=A0A3E0HQC4_9PSEU|nr:helix-turn-helix domain-containing protein [Kutzneria buriramensis]REH48627.1 AcrR family transcriptional regulator [Kutzneria buriramensis]